MVAPTLRTIDADALLSWSLEIDIEDGRLVWAASGAPLSTRGGCAGLFGIDSGRPCDRFLYVLDERSQLYVAEPNTLSPDLAAYHSGSELSELALWRHSSFTAGQPVLCAGDLETDAHGRLLRISNWSGCYRPDDRALAYALYALEREGVDLGAVLAEIVQPDGYLSIVDAAALCRQGSVGGLLDRGLEIRCRDAMDAAQQLLGRSWDERSLARLQRQITASLADPEGFEPRDPCHWNWIARWALEGDVPEGDAPALSPADQSAA